MQLTVAIIAVCILIVVIYVLARLCGIIEYDGERDHILTPTNWLNAIRQVFAGIPETGLHEEAVEINDEDEWEEDAYHDPGPLDEISQMAVEVNAGPVYGPETFEFADMMLRLTKPHCYADDWYSTARREFSAWAAEQWRLIAVHRREMGLAA